MSQVDMIVSVASWEPRFRLGTERLLKSASPRKTLVYYYSEYAPRTESSRAAVREMCSTHGVEYEERELCFGNPGENWRKLANDLAKPAPLTAEVLIDISTMPRETIWATLFWLQASNRPFRYVYHRPEKYGTGWLARDPEQPRLAFKLAGQPKLDRPTALLAVTGYDTDRALQAIEYFEPTRVILAVQSGPQYENSERNITPHCGGAFGCDRVSKCEVDAYSMDHGYAILRNAAMSLTVDYNVVLCSFGPKLSAIAIYRVQREMDECALAYIHCQDYSPAYSDGIGDAVEGALSEPQLGGPVSYADG